jgi:hypothetical protein
MTRDVLGHGGPLDRGDRQQRPTVNGLVRGYRVALHDIAKALRQLWVVVKPQDGRRLGHALGELGPIPLRQAPHRHDLGPRVRRRQHGVDGVLLGRLNEPTCVDNNHIWGLVGINQLPAPIPQAPGQLLGVDLIARTPKCEQRDPAGRRRRRHA